MRRDIGVGPVLLGLAAWLGAPASRSTAAPPPGKPYVLTIKGENTITFVPETGLAPLPVDYKAAIEYLVRTRDVETTPAKKTAVRRKGGRRTPRSGDREPNEGGDDDAPRPAAAVDLSIHSAEMALRHRERMVVQTRISRSRFQGRLLPDAPPLTVTYYQAPPALQELLKTFDTTAASIVIDDRANVIERRVRGEGPLHAIIETLLSIHTPIPRDVASWEAPTQLAMGHGQTARGTLRFEKEKASVSPDGGLVKVKVSGNLTAEGAIAGHFIKDGTYRVSGEQTYDPRSREWRSARWSVEIETDLTNQGATVAHGRGKMLVESRALSGPPAGRTPASGERPAGGPASSANEG